MNKKGFTLIEILIVIAILAILTMIAIPNILRVRMSANDAIAQTTLKTISKAIEQFLISNSTYPASVDELTTATPPYLNQDYFIGTRAGFTYSSTLTPGTYSIVATPVSVGQSGTTIFTITTGAVLQGN